MSTLIAVGLALAGVAGLIGLVALMAWFGAKQAEKAARAETLAEVDRDAVEAERKAGAVLGEHRSVDDAADRLSKHTF